MKRIKKGLLIALCMLCWLLLTGCYTDNDPWPEAHLGETQATTPPTVTVVPATDVPATAVPATLQPATPESNLGETQATTPPTVTATPEPLPEDAVDVSPNFNG